MRAEKERREKMGVFVNPGNEAFAVALNSEIYVDKTELLTYTNKVMKTCRDISATVARDGLENRSRPICSRRITAKAVVPEKCFPIWVSVKQKALKNT